VGASKDKEEQVNEEWTTVYKVVRITRDKKLISAVIERRSGALVYDVGLVTRPNFPNEPIFAFCSEGWARRFFNDYHSDMVALYEARALNVRPGERCCSFTGWTSRRHQFWKFFLGERVRAKVRTMLTPQGTVFCDALELVRLVAPSGGGT
jgi:hypothetical protein